MLTILFFSFLNQKICCGYTKESSHSDGSFEHPNHMYKNNYMYSFMLKMIFFHISQQKYMLWVHKKSSHSDGSFEHPKHMFKLKCKKIITCTVLC